MENTTLCPKMNTTTNSDYNFEPDGETESNRTNPPLTRNIFNRLFNYAFCSQLTVRDALDGPEAEQWRAAMNDEINSLIENRTYELVDLPPGKKTHQVQIGL